MGKLLVFIGFGEAAYHIAKGLKSEGLDEMAAYDANFCDESRGELIRSRAQETGVPLFESLEEAYRSAKFIVSLTSAKVAYDVANGVIPYLREGQVYVDMNAAGPTVKNAISEIKRKEGVLVCDAAVMSTVPQNGHKVPMLLSGDGAKAFYESLAPYHMNLTDLQAEAGGSSAIKMFRSVLMKGLPQLMFESMVPPRVTGCSIRWSNP